MSELKKLGTTNMNTPVAAKKAPAKKEEGAKIDTKDGYKGSVEDKKEEKPIAGWKRAILNVTDKASATVGTLAGLVGGTAGLYAGAAGGAILLGALGLGLGPAVAAVTTSGVLSGLATTFGTAGALGKVGIVAGSLTTGYGMFKAGRKVVDVIDAVPRKLFGVAKKKEKEQVDPPKKSGLAEGLVGAVGAGSGAIGGAVAGAGVAAAGATLEGLLATGVTLSAVSGAGLVGAGIGAAIFGLGGFVGAWSLIGKAKSGIKKGMKMLFKGRKFMELQKKEELLRDKETEMKTEIANFRKEADKAEALHDRRSKEQDKKDAFLKSEATRLQTKEANMDRIIDEKSDKMYEDKAKELFIKEDKLDVREDGLNKWEAKVDKKEQEVDKHIEEGATALYNERKVDLEEEYTDKFERMMAIRKKLQQRNEKLDQEVADKVAKKLKPLKKEWETRVDSAKNKEREASDKLYRANREYETARRYKNDAEMDRREARADKQAASQIRREAEFAREKVEQDKIRLRRKEQSLNRWEKELQQRENQLNGR